MEYIKSIHEQISYKYLVVHFVKPLSDYLVQSFHDKNFCVKIFCMIYVNDCSIRVVQSKVKIFHIRNFRTSFAYNYMKIILQ